VKDELLQALMPVYQEILGGSAGASEVGFQGPLASWPLLEVLRTVHDAHRSGEFTLSHGDRRTKIFLRRGEVVLATSHDPAQYAQDSGVDLHSVNEQAKAAAEAEQRSSGKPVFVSLAENGSLPSTDLSALLERQGRRLLAEVLDARGGTFRFRELPTTPMYVDAYGRRMTLAQLELDRLRQSADRAKIEPAFAAADAVFERQGDFSRKLKQLELSSKERRVLTLVDGKTTVKQLVERSGLSGKEATLILFRLAATDLVRNRPPRARPRPVMILEPDIEGFQKPLRRLLQERAEPVDLVTLEGAKDLVDTILKARPSLVILNASGDTEAARRAARAVCASGELPDLSLVALLDGPQGPQVEELSAAGFDAVLCKPVHYLDLEKLIAA
jgi:hypothetical protein